MHNRFRIEYHIFVHWGPNGVKDFIFLLTGNVKTSFPLFIQIKVII